MLIIHSVVEQVAFIKYLGYLSKPLFQRECIDIIVIYMSALGTGVFDCEFCGLLSTVLRRRYYAVLENFHILPVGMGGLAGDLTVGIRNYYRASKLTSGVWKIENFHILPVSMGGLAGD
jgi:hypothetical protein